MVITNTGFAAVAARIGLDTQSTVTAFDFIDIGTGTTAAAASNTSLQTGKHSAAATGTLTTTTQTNDTLQLVKDAFTFTGNEAVTEVGVFNMVAGGVGRVMLSHVTFAAVNVTSADTLKMTVKEQVKQGT